MDCEYSIILKIKISLVIHYLLQQKNDDFVAKKKS